MRNNVNIIIKKELYRFFKDPKMILSVILMPGLLIFTMYSILSYGLNFTQSMDTTYQPTCYIQNIPTSLENNLRNSNLCIKEFTDIETAKKQVTDKSLDIIIVFPKEFDEYLEHINNIITPIKIELYYNSSKKESASIYSNIVDQINKYESNLVNIFDINTETSDLSSSQDKASSIVSSILPMMIIMFIFTGCLNLAPESIAGEKERGTIATLLVTPIKRTDIAIGKIISVGIIALLNGISSFIGIVCAMYKMVEFDNSDLVIAVYGIKEYLLLIFVILSTVLLIVSIISIISALSKSVREASAFSSPLMIISMLISIIPMLNSDFSNYAWRIIPIYNSVLCLNDVLSFNISAINILIAITSNFIYTAIFIIVLSMILKSENIMFKK